MCKEPCIHLTCAGLGVNDVELMMTVGEVHSKLWMGRVPRDPSVMTLHVNFGIEDVAVAREARAREVAFVQQYDTY